MANPNITALPAAPKRSDAPADFTTKADAFVAALPGLVTETNTTITWMGQQVTTVSGYVTQAASSATAAAQSVTDAAAQVTLAAAQVKLAGDQAVASKGSADAAATSLASTQTVAAAVQSSAGLPSLKGNARKYWRVSDDEKTLELVTLSPQVVGDVLITAATPDATYVKDNGNYPQVSYPALFSMLGYLNADNAVSTSANTVLTVPSTNGLTLTYGKDEVLFFGTTSSSENPLFIGRSTDYGSTFTKPYSLANSGSTLSVNQIATDSNGVLVAVGGGGLIVRSEDNGVNWSKLTAPTISNSTTYSISCVATNGTGIWIAGTATNKYVLISTDNGKTWSAISVAYNLTLSTLASNGSGVWIGYSTATSSIVKSTDNGSTWTAVSINYSAYGTTGLTTPSAISRIVYSAGCFAFGYYTAVTISSTTYYVIAVAYSLDNGTTFTSVVILNGITNGAELGGIALDKYGTLVLSAYAASSGGYSTYKYTNLNNSKAKVLSSLGGNSTLFASIATNGVFTWSYYRAGSNYGLSRSDPLYNVKTHFNVPLQAVQPYPYQSYVKAKLS